MPIKNSYKILQNIRKDYYFEKYNDYIDKIVVLLSQQGIQLRQDNGKLQQAITSIPTSINNAFVIGLRYIKRDNTCTEDHFLCRKYINPKHGNKEIKPYYGKSLEKMIPEYCGTHKAQVHFNNYFTYTGEANKDKHITSVNTLSNIIP